MAKTDKYGHKIFEITSCGGKYYFDKEAAQRAVDFFEVWLKHTTGAFAGKLFKLQHWQKEELVKPLFGWKRKKDGYRRFRKAFVFIPKKNGKTTLCGGLGLYLTGADGEMRARVYCAATEKEQAKLVFNEAVDMVDLNNELSKVFVTNRSQIYFPATRSSFVPMSKETKSKHGINAHGVIFDELHALKDAELYEVMTKGSGAARKQPLQITITTAGYDQNSICYEEYKHAKNVLEDEKIDEQLLVVIYEADKNDDWTDPKVWRKANPSLGSIISEEYLKEECDVAKDQPRYENTFKRLHLNMWTSQVTRWLNLDRWLGCEKKFSEKDLKGRICYGGLDMSSTQDLSAFVLAFPSDEGIYLLPYFFLPREGLRKKEIRDKVPYSLWEASGFIYTTPGETIEYEAVYNFIVEKCKMFDVKDVGYDPFNATMLVQYLEKARVSMVTISQNFSSISAPTKEFERLILSKRIIHNGNPVMNWMVDNVELRTGPNGVVAPNKPAEKAGVQKRIDGVVAAIMATDRVCRNTMKRTSVYKTRGLRYV